MNFKNYVLSTFFFLFFFLLFSQLLQRLHLFKLIHHLMGGGFQEKGKTQPPIFLLFSQLLQRLHLFKLIHHLMGGGFQLLTEFENERNDVNVRVSFTLIMFCLLNAFIGGEGVWKILVELLLAKPSNRIRSANEKSDGCQREDVL
uniref:Uncharacterized protein n=1 Tax=Glossina palpalis gambiensis TaxID=67801 RepID=A0A1B0BC71_9MUSC